MQERPTKERKKMPRSISKTNSTSNNVRASGETVDINDYSTLALPFVISETNRMMQQYQGVGIHDCICDSYDEVDEILDEVMEILDSNPIVAIRKGSKGKRGRMEPRN